MAARVLVVDDEPSVRFFGRMALEEAGLLVDEAASGREALGILQGPDSDIAAVVLDFRMPGMTGLETARVLRAGGIDLPIVLYTAYADPAVAAAAAELQLELIDKTDVDRMVGHVGDVITAA